MSSLEKRRAQNILWILFEKGGHIAISVLAFVLYGFFLSPEELGVAIIILATVELASMLICSLLDNSLIREGRLSTEKFGSVFWASSLLGGLLGLLACVFLLWYFSNADLTFMIVLVSFYVPIQACVRPHIVEMRKRSEFKKLTYRTLIAKTSGALVGIALAWLSFGSAAVVGQQMVGALVATFVLLWLERRATPFTFEPEFLKKMLVVGLPSALKNIVHNLLNRVGILILGGVSGAASAGFFSFGQKLTQLPKDAVETAVVTYGHTVFSNRRNEIDQLATLYRDVTRMVLVILLPMFLGFAAVSDNVVTSIYGMKWDASIYIVHGLAVNAAITFVFVFLPSLLVATANNARLLVLDAVIVFSVLAGCVLFAKDYGELVLLCGVLLRTIVLVPFQIRVLTHITGRSLTYLYLGSLPQIVSAFVMYAAVIFIGEQLYLKPSIEVAIQVVSGIVIYFAILLVLWPNAVSDCRKIMNK
jgi:O-antigen/teichoic acid export membrane protein